MRLKPGVEPSKMRILLADILTFDGFFGAKFDILKPRWLLTQASAIAKRRIIVPPVRHPMPLTRNVMTALGI
jgi:hypothetical protein